MRFAAAQKPLGIGQLDGGDLMKKKVVRNLLVVSAAILLIASAIFFVSSRNIKNKDVVFMQSYTETTGEIVGYRQIDYGDDKPKVSFIVEGKEVISEAKAIKLNPQICPTGTQVRIAYVPVKVMGVSGFDVRIVDQDGTMPTLKTNVTVLTVIAGALLTLSLIFVIIILRVSALF